MFTSSYHHTIDAKNRLFIPAKFREEFGDEIVISPSIRGNYLNIYSLEELCYVIEHHTYLMDEYFFTEELA